MKLHTNVCSHLQWARLKQLLVIMLLELSISVTYGQTGMVSGVVKSESDGEPLTGATVKVKENNTGCTTDINGRYSIMEEWETLRKYHQICIDAVRTTGGRNFYRTILIQTPNTNINLAVELMERLPRDHTPNCLGIEVHYYEPSTFCILNEDGAWGGAMCQWFWGEEQQKYATGDFAVRWKKDGNELHVREQFRKMYDKFVSQGYPVLVGEYGMMRRKLTDETAQEGHEISCEAFARTVTAEAKAHGCTPCYWSGVFNRLTGEVTDSFVSNGLEEGAKTEYLSFNK